MSEPRYDFANVLFAGPCNRACPWCIGLALPDRVNVDNLDLFPPRNADGLVEACNAHGVRQIVFTGTTTDPQLYRHEGALLDYLRARVTTGAQYSVHTNGALALRKIDTFNLYDRACLSLPSFEPDTYEKMMGSRRVPDLEGILARARIPVKVSCVVDAPNAGEIPAFLARCRALGVRRVVLRELYGVPGARRYDLPVLRTLAQRGAYRGNPVYDLDGMEVAYWSFHASGCESLNLFADGTLGTTYHLDRTPELVAA